MMGTGNWYQIAYIWRAQAIRPEEKRYRSHQLFASVPEEADCQVVCGKVSAGSQRVDVFPDQRSPLPAKSSRGAVH